MKNHNPLFLDFATRLEVNQTQKNQIDKSIEFVKNNIRKYFDRKFINVEFRLQGSFALGTLIKKDNDYCDADIGLYIENDLSLKPNTLKDYLSESVENITDFLPSNRNKCVTIEYKNSYSIDIPIYVKKEDRWFLVTKDNYLASDIQGFHQWFHEKSEKATNKNKYDQIIRIIKYLKAWSAKCATVMPSGVAITVLVLDLYDLAKKNVQNQRDDTMLLSIVQLIIEKISREFEVKMPVDPMDNLLEPTIRKKSKDVVLEEFRSLHESLIKSSEEPMQDEAASILKRKFGDNFPNGRNISADDLEQEISPIISTMKESNFGTDSNGVITNRQSSVVTNIPHKFYGD